MISNMDSSILRRASIYSKMSSFGDHSIQFQHDFAPSSKIKDLICAEMDLVGEDFDQTLGHLRSLKSQVGRHLDLLIQFRVLD